MPLVLTIPGDIDVRVNELFGFANSNFRLGLKKTREGPFAAFNPGPSVFVAISRVCDR